MQKPDISRSESVEAVLGNRLFATRSRRVCAALVLLWVLNVFDLVVTLLRVEAGSFQEGNPIARMLLTSPAILVAWKLGLLAAATIIFLAYRKIRIAEIGCWGACAVYLALAHLWWVYHGL